MTACKEEDCECRSVVAASGAARGMATATAATAGNGVGLAAIAPAESSEPRKLSLAPVAGTLGTRNWLVGLGHGAQRVEHDLTVGAEILVYRHSWRVSPERELSSVVTFIIHFTLGRVKNHVP
jgi:hypothetical protein